MGIFSHGWGGRGIRHPNVSNMINPPVRLIAYVLDSIGLVKDSQEVIRSNIALIISPMASAVKIFVFGLILSTLGANKTQLIIGMLIAAASFSQLIFGTIPESFGISGMALTITFLLLVKDVKHGDQITWWAWFILGVFSIGITLTNIAFIGILFLTLLFSQKRSFRFVIIAGSSLLAIILTASLALHLVMNYIYEIDESTSLTAEQAKNSYTKYAHQNITNNIKTFPYALADSIAPGEPIARDIGYETKGLYKYVVTLKKYNERGGFSIINLVLLFSLVFSAIYSWRGSKVLKAVIASSISILLYNCILHSLWGSRELFLYSQHWHTAIALLLVTTSLVHNDRNTYSLLVGAVMLIISVNNILRLQQVFDFLSKT